MVWPMPGRQTREKPAQSYKGVRSRRWRGGSIELVGTAPIDMAGTFISDHFGLEASIIVNGG